MVLRTPGNKSRISAVTQRRKGKRFADEVGFCPAHMSAPPTLIPRPPPLAPHTSSHDSPYPRVTLYISYLIFSYHGNLICISSYISVVCCLSFVVCCLCWLFCPCRRYHIPYSVFCIPYPSCPVTLCEYSATCPVVRYPESRLASDKRIKVKGNRSDKSHRTWSQEPGARHSFSFAKRAIERQGLCGQMGVANALTHSPGGVQGRNARVA